MLSILLGIVALSVLIIIHECGHFVAAKWAGLHVDRFSIFGIGAPILRLGPYRGTECGGGWVPSLAGRWPTTPPR
jgi:regulator of sigma E protease